MTGLLCAAGIIGAIGIIIGVLLGIASEKFKVEVDEKEVLVRAELPGNNCGGAVSRAATVWRLPLLQAQLRLMAVQSVELQLQTRLQRSWAFQAEQVSRRLPLSNVKAPAIRAA